ncbi:MAG: PTS cellobiose transporter subunit IIC [Culicoidibacterales bacterium]
MEKLFNLLEKTLMSPMTKIARMKYIKAIMNAGMASVPFTIVGSMFLVVNNIPTSFPSTKAFFDETVLRFSGLTSAVTMMSLGAISIFFCLATAYYLAEVYRDEDGVNINPLNAAFLAIFGFLTTCVQVVYTAGNFVYAPDVPMKAAVGTMGGVTFQYGNIIRFSGQGVFVAILMGFLATEIYRFCMVKNITIKMPEGVPEGVSRSFAALIPGFLIAFSVILINGVLVYFGTDIHGVISLPFGFLANMISTWPGLMLMIFITIALWVVGIHGAAIIGNIVSPLLLVNMTANATAISNGQHATQVIAGEFMNSYVWIGGSGGTLGLAFVLAFLVKSPQLKAIGRSSIIPGFFNINEPIIFGVPLVYNPFLIIPFFLAPMISGTIAYVLTATGFAGYLYASVPWTSPVGLAAFTSSGGSVGALLTALLCVVVSVIIWYPFVRLYDKSLVKEMEANLQTA